MSSHHLNYLLQCRRERSPGVLLLFAAMAFFSLAGVVLAIYFVPHPSLLFGRPEIGSPSNGFLDPIEGQEAGLVLRKFKTNSSYPDSELLVAPTGEVIRCDTKPSVLGPIICERLWPVTLGVMARVRFSRQRLAEWKDIDETAQNLLKEFTR